MLTSFSRDGILRQLDELVFMKWSGQIVPLFPSWRHLTIRSVGVVSGLADLSQRLKWAIVILCRPSVCRLSSSSGVNFSHFRALLQKRLLDYSGNLIWSTQGPTSVVVFRPGRSRGGSMAGQNVPQNDSSLDKLLLQTGCIDRQTECMRAIFKDVERSVVLAPLWSQIVDAFWHFFST